MNKLNYYYNTDKDGYVKPIKIKTPKGINYFEGGTIDFSICNDFIGEAMSLYENGKYFKDVILESIKPNKDGIMALHYKTNKVTQIEKNKKGKREYLWSFENELEDWSYFEGSLEECLEEIKKLNKDRGGEYQKVYVGDYKIYNPKEYIVKSDVEELIDMIIYRSDNLYWLDEIEDKDIQVLAEEIDTVFRHWLKVKHQEPNFGEVVNVKEYKL